MGIDGDLLLTAATASNSGSSRISSLNLLRPEAFDLRELPEPPGDGLELWGRG